MRRLRARLIEVLIKNDAAYAALAERLAQALTRAWSFGVEEAFLDALEVLRGMEPGQFSGADEARILTAIEARIGNEAMRRAMEGPVLRLSEAIWRVGAAEATHPAGVDYAFGVQDELALALLQRFDLHWIGQHWDAGTRATVTDAVREFFSAGWSYEDLAERLRAAFAGVEERGVAYWTLTADTIASKSRELARVSGYEQAGVRYVEVRAHMDHRTTALCRSLHGRLIALGHVQGQRDRYLAAIERGNMLEAKAVWPMLAADSELPGATRTLPANVGLPPYHFRCRTVTVAYLGRDPQALTEPGDDVARLRTATRQREAASRQDLARAVERSLLARWDEGQLAAHRKHAARGIEDYNRAVFELIRGRSVRREIALCLHNGQVCAVYHAPYKPGRVQVAVVNLERLAIVTHHIRRGIESPAYEVQPVAQPKSERIWKWTPWR